MTKKTIATKMIVVVFVISILSFLSTDIMSLLFITIDAYLHPGNDKKIEALWVAGKTPPIGGAFFSYLVWRINQIPAMRRGLNFL